MGLPNLAVNRVMSRESVFADRVGAGVECAINGMLFVLFFLPHHGTILSTSHAAVLGSNAVAVFRHMAVGGQKIAMAVEAPAGSVAMLHAVH